MIKKIQKKFIASAMLSLLIVVIVLITCIDGIMYWKMNTTADALLQYIAQNNGVIPEYEAPVEKGSSNRVYKFDLNEETRFSTRFFTVTYVDGAMVDANIDNIAAVTESEAKNYGDFVFVSGRTSGVCSHYRYLVSENGSRTMIIFVDCQEQQDSISLFMTVSVMTGIFCLIVMFILVSLFSRRAIKTTIESVELQKRFITDAGHEIKTPLAIISANADVLELEHGKSQWIDSIRHQTYQLNRLVKELLNLSKLEEGTKLTTEFGIFSLSDIVANEAVTFQPLVISRNKTINTEITEDIHICGNKESIETLVSILLDNAVKYAADDSEPIDIKLTRDGKNARLDVSNTCDRELSADELDKMFKRFYRLDDSRNRKTGGYGIGLSIAAAVVNMNKGRITARMTAGQRICFTVYLALSTR